MTTLMKHGGEGCVEQERHWRKKMQFKTCYGVSYSNYLHLKSERNEIYSFSPKIFFSSAVNSTSSGKLNNYFLLSAFDFNFS